MMRAAAFAALVLLLPFSIKGQMLRSFSLSADNPLPYGNVVNAILTNFDSIWTGTSNGVAVTNNDGLTWRHFDRSFGFRDGAIAAIASKNGITWVSEATSVREDGQSIPVGVGLYYSTNNGNTWTFIDQPREPSGRTVDTLMYGANKIRALAITVTRQNLTYDIALTRGTVWIASFAGMLRRSDDLGKTWRRVILPPDNRNSIAPTDTLDFDLSPTGGALGLRENLNHRVFSVYASDDSTIWVGTAAGINKSTDGGMSWRRFSHQNQLRGISGNFVVAINEQRWNGSTSGASKRILWAATVNALGATEQRGVSFSDDGGETWRTTLLGEFAHNIAFKDSIVYVVTENGLFRSNDVGQTWLRNGTIYDPTNRQRLTSSQLNAVAVKGDTVWVGGLDGLAYTIDRPTQPFGTFWRVLRRYEPVGKTAQTYSYPSPFSPDDQAVRIHYAVPNPMSNVTIRIFDFGMQLVKTVIQNAPRSGSMEHDEIWNGRDEHGRRVANGVYFYRIDFDGGEPLWGKLFVVE